MAADPMADLRWRFTVEDYERMGEIGIFDPADRVELLDGEIVVMSPIGPKHAGVVNRIAAHLFRRLDGRATVIVQNPLRLLPSSEPQPDLIVARFRRDFYQGAHPTADDVQLVIEVADSSLRTDARSSFRSTPGRVSSRSGLSTSLRTSCICTPTRSTGPIARCAPPVPGRR